VAVFPDDVHRLSRLSDTHLLVHYTQLHLLVYFDGLVIGVLVVERAIKHFGCRQLLQIIIFVLCHLVLDSACFFKLTSLQSECPVAQHMHEWSVVESQLEVGDMVYSLGHAQLVIILHQPFLNFIRQILLEPCNGVFMITRNC